MIVLQEETKSLFGNIPLFYRKRVFNWKKRKNKDNTKFLIIDDKDGLFSMCPLRNNISCTIFEPNKIFTDGGRCEVPMLINDKVVFMERKIDGLKDRIEKEFIKTNFQIINKNYYDIDHYVKYNYVIASQILNENNKYDIEYKINKLKSNVEKNGYLYLNYYVDENYLNKDEILKYFPCSEWTIILNEIKISKNELTPLNKNNNEVLIGYLDVRKKKTPVKKIKHEYILNNEVIKVNHKYIINGVNR